MIPARILDQLGRRLERELAPPAGPLLALRAGKLAFGRVDPGRAARLARFDRVFVRERDGLGLAPGLDTPERRTLALDPVVAALAAEGALTAWRNERYAVASFSSSVPLFSIERAAARYFGIRTRAVHVNGTTLAGGATAMWIARRSPAKSIDPGMLDNMVGGGVAAGLEPAQVLLKEAREEAGLPGELAARATRAAALHLWRAQPDGIQDELILAYDLAMPPGTTPRNEDGEVAAFELATVQQVAAYAAGVDTAKTATADASLVIADWLARHGELPADGDAPRIVQRSRAQG